MNSAAGDSICWSSMTMCRLACRLPSDHLTSDATVRPHAIAAEARALMKMHGLPIS